LAREEAPRKKVGGRKRDRDRRETFRSEIKKGGKGFADPDCIFKKGTSSLEKRKKETGAGEEREESGQSKESLLT